MPMSIVFPKLTVQSAKKYVFGVCCLAKQSITY